jgi:hypothetical protein
MKETAMRVQVTIPVTVTVDYDTDEISTANGEFLTEDTAKVVAGMILDLSDEPMVEALTESTGWLIKGLSIHVDDLTLSYGSIPRKAGN